MHLTPDRPPMKRNMTEGERRGLRDLERDSSIVIKPAAKGSAVVIQDRLYYLREGYKHLSDPVFYKAIDEDLTKTPMLEFQNFKICIKMARYILVSETM